MVLQVLLSDSIYLHVRHAVQSVLQKAAPGVRYVSISGSGVRMFVQDSGHSHVPRFETTSCLLFVFRRGGANLLHRRRLCNRATGVFTEESKEIMTAAQYILITRTHTHTRIGLRGEKTNKKNNIKTPKHLHQTGFQNREHQGTGGDNNRPERIPLQELRYRIGV